MFEIINKENYKSVLINKKTNSMSNIEKINTWEKILTEFNSQVANKRSANQLRNIYRNEWASIRTQLAEEHRQRRTTGGGKFVSGTLDDNPLLSFVQESVTPMENIDSTDDYIIYLFLHLLKYFVNSDSSHFWQFNLASSMK